MYNDWRARKAAKRKEAKENHIEMPAFVPLIQIDEDSPRITVIETDNAKKMSPRTAGGVRMHRDDSRSFLQTEEDKEESDSEDDEKKEKLKNGMLFM